LPAGVRLRFIDVFNMKKPIFLQAAIVSLLVVAAGCMTTGARRGQAVTPADYDETIRVACVGDSITFGAGIKDRKNDNYPVVLGRSLGEMFEVRNFGVSGATLLKAGDFSYWKTPAFKAATNFDPHVVVIKLGTNDTKPQNWKHAVQYAADNLAVFARAGLSNALGHKREECRRGRHPQVAGLGQAQRVAGHRPVLRA
jgi:hypothetical protein